MRFHLRNKSCRCSPATEQQECPDKNCIPTTLSQRRHRGRVRICQIVGDRKLCSHMAAMGVYPGSEAELLCPANGGQCLLRVNDSTICLDEKATDQIIVSQL